MLLFLPFRLFPNSLEIKIYKAIILPVVLCGCETWSLSYITGGMQAKGN